MSNTYTTNLKLVQPDLTTTGWGTLVNNSLTALVDVAVSGVENIDVTAGNIAMTIDDGAQSTNDARNMFIVVGGTLPANRTVTVPTNSKLYFVHNNTAGAHTLSFEATAGVLIPQGKKVPLYSDGTDILYAFDHLGSLTLDTALAATSGGTGQSSYAIGDLLYADTTTSLAKLAAVAEGSVLRSKGTGTAPAWEQVDLTTDVTGILPVANGGTGAATLTANSVLLGNGTGAVQEVAPGTDGNILTSNGTTWQSVAAPPKTLSVDQFASTTTWTAPVGVTQVKITVTGGGGGGGANNTGGDGGSGGYGGACVALVTVAPGTTYEVTIGAGGVGSNTTGVNGNAGTETWFGVNSGTKLISCTGGGGGVAATAGSPGANGSNGTATITGTTLRSGFYASVSAIGGDAQRDVATTAATAWSASSQFVPGAGGRGEYSPSSNASGGVGGFIQIEYVG